MSVSTATTADVAQVLAEVLGGVDGLRVYAYSADSARPPVAIIQQADIDYQDPETPFCFGTYTFPVLIVVSRNQDAAAQASLAQFVNDAARALSDAQPDGVFSIEPLSASPQTVSISGQELAGYSLRVQVRA